MLAAASVAAILSACGTTGSGPRTVSVLPAATARGQSWGWDAACPYGPHNATECDPAGPVLGTAQLAGDEWNLGPAPGGQSVTMSLTQSGALHLRAALPQAAPCTSPGCLTTQANTWVRGFPSVLYGIDQCHAKTSPAPSPALRLPARVDSLPADLVGRADYDEQASQVTYDVTYDLWLSPSDTTSPCLSDGTVEVLVWTDYDTQALLPDSLRVGTATLPYSVDGVSSAGDQKWSVYANNVYGSGHTGPAGGTVWLVLDAADTTKRGAVNVDLSASLATVGALLQHTYGWAPFGHSYWLDTIAFGLEYGPQNADPYGRGPTDFSLDLNSYCLAVRTSVSAATC